MAFFLYIYSFFNASPLSCNTERSFGMEYGPIPCRDKISFSLYFASSSTVITPMFSKARRAGAESLDKKPIVGFRSFSHMGHVGQSLLL